MNGRGESTIHPNFVEILNYTKSRYPNVRINLFSNFSFKNEEIINSLIKNQVQLFISMDSSNEDELVKIRKGAKAKYINSNIQKIKNYLLALSLFLPYKKKIHIEFLILQNSLLTIIAIYYTIP
ncbi:MAG: hypothetical protein Q4B43_10740 [Bacteroidota bacterium]|nr:hypothetical protein [Bacteroidota bacterium]